MPLRRVLECKVGRVLIAIERGAPCQQGRVLNDKEGGSSMPRRGCSMPTGRASKFQAEGLHANEGGRSVPTTGWCSTPMREGAQCQRGGGGVLNANEGTLNTNKMGGCSVPTVVCAQCQL